MATQIFVNLPVKDLKRSIDFFTSLGYSFNPQFTDEKATCMIISDDIYVMLLVEPFFKTFINKEIADATKTTESIICLSTDSREEVDNLVGKAVAAGGSTIEDPQDYGYMYSHGFQDLDGHLWNILYMDPSAVQPEEPASAMKA
jgi:predicted lactoylglutathione lyase